MSHNIFRKVAHYCSSISLFLLVALSSPGLALADSVVVNFESPTYPLGVIDGVEGWTSTGAATGSCALYDHMVDSSLATVGFGDQSLRVSNAATSGCFGDQTFAKPLTDAVGEADATAGSYSEGTRQTHFAMEFDFASTSLSHQPGLFVSLSPDRGDGSRMSYLGFEDMETGVNLIFYDVQDENMGFQVANFVLTDLGILDRSIVHHIKLEMDMFDGSSNDVVRVYVDGSLVHTGTSWENYFRFDTEASAEQTPRIVKTVIFRTGGPAAPSTLGGGFLFDNLELTSSTPFELSTPVITEPANGATVTVSDMVKVDWTDSTGTYPPFEYQYEAYADSGYTSLIYASAWLAVSEIPTPGTPPDEYYLRVRARDSLLNESGWSSGASSPYLVTVIPDPVLIGPPTDKDQCKDDGWQTFNNPPFKNQGQCVRYVLQAEREARLEERRRLREEALRLLREALARLHRRR